MPDKVHISWEEAHQLADTVAERIQQIDTGGMCRLYGVPNGGIYAVLLVQQALQRKNCASFIVEAVEACDIIIDDIIDSGKTRLSYNGQKPFLALMDKLGTHKGMGWAVFPWERQLKIDGPQDNIRRLLEYIGEDPNREGLRNTPDRIVRSYEELFSGYKEDPRSALTVFEEGVCDSMVLLRKIEVVSFCEHHWLPFVGLAHIAYIPNKKVIGVSKLARIMEIYSRRLQIQERLTEQITTALDDHLQPKGSACVIEARHSCMSCRGVNKQHSEMVTSSLTGDFRAPEVRAEFFNLIRP